MRAHYLVQPNCWVALRLPSDTLKVLLMVPNTIVSLGKYGTFASNDILQRPYHLTYELLDRQEGHKDSGLRIVPASEIHEDTIAEEDAASSPKSDEAIIGGDGVEYELVGEDGEVIMRSNRETIDDSARQTLTMDQIETLKREGTGAGKHLIAKLMLSHTALDQKTSFSLAKYKLLKTKKYLRRFTVLPLDVPLLLNWYLSEKDPGKIMEMRDEMMGLTGSWANVHFSQSLPDAEGGRWLVVDETGGLLVAAMAERMGILYPSEEQLQSSSGNAHHREDAPLATSNTLTMVHNNAQPNLSLLKYFLFDPATTTQPCPDHPLNSHLQAISWLQLVSPEKDTFYSTSVEQLSPEELEAFKPGKRGTYYRKLRRWQRTTSIVDTALAGGFSGIVVASSMDPTSIIRHTIPLLRGGANISIYSPTIEPLVMLVDNYSTSRRTAFITSPPDSFTSLETDQERDNWKGDEDFPLNPTLILNASVQTARVRSWQVLPGRTHPVMTGKGGAEGYLFTGVRVVPARGKVEARGKFGKKRKADEIAANGRSDMKKGKLEGEAEELAATPAATDNGDDVVDVRMASPTL
ncbi:Gcd10p family-domain-containing protein [Amylocarpus encephaloides]|uniref:tRNA (adenine(58)-N(1))-methyltransferase non-catalytic subunit TRM6 n=1 Tax=Amylocarpus encephaloides TaxID=45428 RepID=A0A9P7Y9W7_9HELO|nr:Gcd10p family-domain-containing protein [Amylocarpus encephaloides]